LRGQKIVESPGNALCGLYAHTDVVRVKDLGFFRMTRDLSDLIAHNAGFQHSGNRRRAQIAKLQVFDAGIFTGRRREMTDEEEDALRRFGRFTSDEEVRTIFANMIQTLEITEEDVESLRRKADEYSITEEELDSIYQSHRQIALARHGIEDEPGEDAYVSESVAETIADEELEFLDETEPEGDVDLSFDFGENIESSPEADQPAAVAAGSEQSPAAGSEQQRPPTPSRKLEDLYQPDQPSLIGADMEEGLFAEGGAKPLDLFAGSPEKQTTKKDLQADFARQQLTKAVGKVLADFLLKPDSAIQKIITAIKTDALKKPDLYKENGNLLIEPLKVLNRLKTNNQTVAEYLTQAGLFGGRFEEVNAEQKDLLQKLENAGADEAVAAVREFLENAGADEAAPTEIKQIADERAKDIEAINEKSAETEPGVALKSATDEGNFFLDAIPDLARQENRLAEDLYKFRRGENRHGQLIRILNETPMVLSRLGMSSKPIVITPKIIKKIEREHKLSANVINLMPRAFADPVMVFKSNTQEASLVIITDVFRKKDNAPVMAAIYVNESREADAVHGVKSIYARNKVEDIQRWIEKGLLLYINNEKSADWIRRAGLRLPLPRIKQHSPSNLLTETDFVNKSGDEFTPLKSVSEEGDINLEFLYNERGEIDYERVKTVSSRILSGEIQIVRLNEAEEEGRIRGGRRNVEASLLIGANESADRGSPAREKRAREEQILEKFARQEGFWIDDLSAFTRRLTYLERGMESKVFFDKNNPGKVIKISPIPHVSGADSSFLRFFDDKIALHNSLPYTAPYELIAFTRDADGTFLAVLEQPFIQGKEITKPDPGLAKILYKEAGLLLDYMGTRFVNDRISVHDIQNHNVVKTKDGRFFIFDPIISFRNVSDYQSFTIRPARRRTSEEPAGGTPFEPLKSAAETDDGKSNVINLKTLYNKNGEFDYETVRNVAEGVERGENAVARLDPAEEQGRIAGGRRNVEASIICGADARTNPTESRGSRPTRKEKLERNTRVESLLEKYARHEGIWFDFEKFEKDHTYLVSGQEAHIFKENNTPFILKAVDYDFGKHGISPLEFIDNRISLFNYLFPASKYELVGFTRDRDGRFRFILRQQYFEGRPPHPRTRTAYMTRLLGENGESLTPEQYVSPDYHIWDLHLKNLIQSDGEIFVIDALLELNTPARHLGGIREYKPFELRTIKESFEPLKSVAEPADAPSEAFEWREDFPDIVPQTTGTKVKSHPDYARAKAGNTKAALRVVKDVVNPAKINALAERHPGALVVPVLAEEQRGRNKLPLAFAAVIAKKTGLEVEHEIMQSNRAFHTGADINRRLFVNPVFVGEIVPGREYILVDDVATSGSTFKALKEYIEARGGRVVEAATLFNTSHPLGGNSGYLAIKKETIARLEKRFDIDELNKL
jgi:adenine/guanine phosphoribosyltransferase-like PRPP-binding protein